MHRYLLMIKSGGASLQTDLNSVPLGAAVRDAGRVVIHHVVMNTDDWAGSWTLCLPPA